MLGLVLAYGSQEAKAPAERAASPEKAEKAAPQAIPEQAAPLEIHSFQAMTLTDQQFLTGRKEGKPVTLPGELRLSLHIGSSQTQGWVKMGKDYASLPLAHSRS